MFTNPLLSGLFVVAAVVVFIILCYRNVHTGIAALIFGCLVRGIVNVSGRFTAYDRVYWATGGALLLAALLAGTAGGLFHTTGKAP